MHTNLFFFFFLFCLFCLSVSAANSSHYRQQENDRILRLPGQSFNASFAHYSGYVDVGESGSGRALFYWLFEAAADPMRSPSSFGSPEVYFLFPPSLRPSLVGNALTDSFLDHHGAFEYYWMAGLISDRTYQMLNLHCTSLSFLHKSPECDDILDSALKKWEILTSTAFSLHLHFCCHLLRE
uniref:Uncharacterized protein n=1 Tax=Ananas comosus var. bracteatus TaxID=296719 RepID=A0A6V7P4P3_ANACO|nr:unnamed protein product [Ananas comosus var. bracteatus]